MASPPATSQTAASSASGGSAPAAARLAGRSRPFSLRYAVCLGLLTASAIGMPSLAGFLGYHLQKKAVPLKRPLATMDFEKLAPEYALHPAIVEPIPEDVIESLGTREYLQWRIVDTRKAVSDPTAVAHVFISYYTGKPDLVPHVPDECMKAAGYDRVGSPSTTNVIARGIGAAGDRVPVRVIQFIKPRQSDMLLADPKAGQVTVLYFFHSNGDYCTTRNEVRLMQANPLQKYAYYSKFEVRFTDYRFGADASTQQSLEALPPLLEKLMPVILKDHFSWDEVNGKAPAPPGAARS